MILDDKGVIHPRDHFSNEVLDDTLQDTHHDTHQDTHQDTYQDTHQDTHQDILLGNLSDEPLESLTEKQKELIMFCKLPKNRVKMMAHVGLKDPVNFRSNYLVPLLHYKLIEMTVKDKPNSRNQKYVVTDEGKKFLNK